MKLKTSLKQNYPNTTDNPYYIFDYFSSFSWELCNISSLNKRITGEETITDLLVAYLESVNNKNIQVLKFNKHQESKNGADLLILKKINKTLYGFYIQAKILTETPNSVKGIPKYQLRKEINLPSINHHYPKIQQYQLLEFYARNNSCIPLYAFYNNIKALPIYNNPIQPCADRCCGNHNYQNNDYGISICTTTTVANQINSNKHYSKSFKALHGYNSSLPIQALFCNNFDVRLLGSFEPCNNPILIKIFENRNLSDDIVKKILLGIPNTIICVSDD